MLSQFVTDPLSAMRIALLVEYNGRCYHGWQIQRDPEVATVQKTLESALSSVADSTVTSCCAGRTDAGVHAVHQVIHFDSPNLRSQKAWVCGANSLLPDDIVVKDAFAVTDDFHARYSAKSRTYRYFIYNSPTRSGVATGLLTWSKLNLDHQLMHRAAQALLGENDFSAFRAAACQSNSPFRCVEYLHVKRNGALICVEIKANAFLLHMVRNIVGALLEVGAGRQPVSWLQALLDGKDRCAAAATAPPDGLYLVGVEYPVEFGIPSVPQGAPFCLQM